MSCFHPSNRDERSTAITSSLSWPAGFGLLLLLLVWEAHAQVAPTILPQPEGQCVSFGANVTLTVVADGSLPLSYRWRLNSTNLVSGTNASLTVSNVTFLRGGNYTVVVSNNYGAVTSMVAAVNVD